MTQFTLSQLTAQLGGELIGNDIVITAIAPAARAQAHEITFLANPKYKSEVEHSQAGAIIVAQKAAALFPNRNLIIAADPYLYFAQVARLFHPAPIAQAGIHPTAVIDPTARVPASCEIGANVYIGARTVLGEQCRILPNSVVEHDCTLGSQVVLHPNVTVYHGCTLGERVEIHSGSIIGADGFGLAFAGDHWLKIPQTGAVTLGDDVEIGANTTIDRGAMSDTTIGRGTKIDNLIQIAHKTTIGGGTSVTHSIKESGTHYASIYPMQTFREWTRNAVHLNHLNEMHKRLKALEAQLAERNGNEE